MHPLGRKRLITKARSAGVSRWTFPHAALASFKA